jgi:hypothetical protein
MEKETYVARLRVWQRMVPDCASEDELSFMIPLLFKPAVGIGLFLMKMALLTAGMIFCRSAEEYDANTPPACVSSFRWKG